MKSLGQHLDSLYESDRFEYLVMYGRRRVGKTTLLQEFSKHTNSIFYPAREKNDTLNLEDFSKAVQLHFDHTYIASFQSWEAAFEYISKKVTDRTAIIIDEFPYIVQENPTIKSILQHTIDHDWKNKNIFLILCGSSVSIMENEIMGSKSPLHDRQTSTLEIKPFDYYDSAAFFPDYSNEHKLISYGILGGIPRYLEAFNPKKDIQTNIASNIIKEGSYLYEEPDNLLKAELRETNIYNSILSAIASGRNKIIEIANYIHEDKAKVAKYLLTLQTLRLVEKAVPCGESNNSRKSIYVIKDNFFRFYFRYQFTNNTYYAMLGEGEASEEIMNDISNLMGNAFEQIAKEYLIRKAKERKLPFIPFTIRKWWGNNPIIKAQDDVDVMAIDRSGNKAIFMECKFTSSPMPYSEYEDLVTATKAFPDIKEKYLYFISRSGYTESVKKQATIDRAVLLEIDDLFI
ncbi:MAG: ATP-binding protein [Floccifex sp.]